MVLIILCFQWACGLDLSKGNLGKERRLTNIARIVRTSLEEYLSFKGIDRLGMRRAVSHLSGHHVTPNSTVGQQDALLSHADVDHLLKIILEKYNNTDISESIIRDMLYVAVGRPLETDKDCPFMVPPDCDPGEKYRSYNGECNNLKHPFWGSSGTPFTRLIPPDYDDFLNIPRNTGKDGTDLPLPREVSSLVHTAANRNDVFHHLTNLVMLFGQFLSHDISSTPASPDVCCPQELTCYREKLLSKMISKKRISCYPIEVPENDPKFRGRCMNFVRSETISRTDCKLGAREQVNAMSSYIDGSAIYGATEEDAYNLRSKVNGLLKTTGEKNNSLPHTDKQCSAPRDKDHKCFTAGDKRVNLYSLLTGFHTIWLRKHNQIATELKRQNPTLCDEVLYQTTRKIVGAQLQHVTYNEWLPIILGDDMMGKHGLTLESKGYFTSYDRNLNPGIANVFATSAFRFGHSMISSGVGRYDNKFGTYQGTLLRETMFNLEPFYDKSQGGLDSIMRATTTDKLQQIDAKFAPDITEHLFEGHCEEEDITAKLVSEDQSISHVIYSMAPVPSYGREPHSKTLERLGEWVMVDLGKACMVTGIIIRGNWATTFHVSYSIDGSIFVFYNLPPGHVKMFKQSSSKTYNFKRLFNARFIRVYPERIVSTVERFAVLGCAKDAEPLQLFVKNLRNDAFAASSILSKAHTADKSKCSGLLEESCGQYIWAPQVSNTTQFVSVDLGSIKQVTGIVTQGLPPLEAGVIKYHLSYSADGHNYTLYKDSMKCVSEDCQYELYADHRGGTTINYLKSFKARYLKLLPKDWNCFLTLRFDVFGYETPTSAATTKASDLVSLNIQRGRDHGLPGYNTWRKFCQLPEASHFGITGGLDDIDQAEIREKLKLLYRHPDDIDLFTASVSERPVPGALVGPTLVCLLGLQFHLLKYGDRFWYENEVTGFSPEQLNEIKKTSLARIYCDTLDIDHIQPHILLKVNSRTNKRQPCSTIPNTDYGKFIPSYKGT
nr:mantle peroxidase-like protein [Terebratalia transversa]